MHDLHRQLGPVAPGVSEAVRDGDLSVASVLSGNRNFEGRIHPDVRMNYLASPPLVVAYALAGTMDIDLTTDPLAPAPMDGPVHLAELWPTAEEITETIRSSLASEMFRQRYAAVFDGDDRWRSVRRPRAAPSTGTSTRPMSSGPRSSKGCRRSPPRSPTWSGPGCWPSWATA